VLLNHIVKLYIPEPELKFNLFDISTYAEEAPGTDSDPSPTAGFVDDIEQFIVGALLVPTVPTLDIRLFEIRPTVWLQP